MVYSAQKAWNGLILAFWPFHPNSFAFFSENEPKITFDFNISFLRARFELTEPEPEPASQKHNFVDIGSFKLKLWPPKG